MASNEDDDERKRKRMQNNEKRRESYAKMKEQKKGKYIPVDGCLLRTNRHSAQNESTLTLVGSFVKRLQKEMNIERWGIIMTEERVLRVIQCSQWTMNDSPMWMKEKSSRHMAVMLPDEEIDRTWLVQFRAESTTEWFSLFEVKKSTQEGTGYGLFAARPYSWGGTLGDFYGVISVKTPHQKRSIYAMERLKMGALVQLFLAGGTLA
jgi:hypothetical protein